MQAFQSVLSMLARMHVLILFASVSLLKPMLSFFTPAKRQHFHTYAYHCQKNETNDQKNKLCFRNTSESVEGLSFPHVRWL